jgi:hypothetical protein
LLLDARFSAAALELFDQRELVFGLAQLRAHARLLVEPESRRASLRQWFSFALSSSS